MFDTAIILLTQFVEWIPFLVCFILIFNIISDLLFGR